MSTMVRELVNREVESGPLESRHPHSWRRGRARKGGAGCGIISCGIKFNLFGRCAMNHRPGIASGYITGKLAVDANSGGIRPIHVGRGEE